ncbi:MAG TPA: pyridoxamine 5'-phosphate oxidase family protein [Stellaceae bacterium]
MAAENEVERLLAAARNTIQEVPFFWVITAAERGDANARVVNAQPTGDDEEFWVRWFLTPRTGRKAMEIGGSRRATLAFQHDTRSAYVTLIGPAELIDDHAEVGSRFCGSQFDDPEGRVASSPIAVRVVAERIELHVRGVTAEPWGRGRTTLERDPSGEWRSLPLVYDAPLPPSKRESGKL